MQLKCVLARAALLGVAGIAMTTAATAATITLNQTLDLTQSSFAPSGFTGVQGAPAFGPGYSVQIGVGDTFDYTIDFEGSQSLTLFNPTLLWAFSYADISSQVSGTGQLSLLDATGGAILTSNVKSDSEGAVHFGQFFYASDFGGGLPSTLNFSGLHYVGTIDGYSEPGVTSRTYNQPAFYFISEGSTVSNVPEPQTVALMFAGLALVTVAARRKNAR